MDEIVRESTKTTRFGTEGSEVRILSPRPITSKACRNAGFFVERYAVLSLVKHLVSLADATVGTECSARQSLPSLRILRDFSPSVARDWSIPSTLRSK